MYLFTYIQMYDYNRKFMLINIGVPEAMRARG